MYDSTRPAEIPADAQMVAGYVDGMYAWGPQDWARFPHAVHVEISAVGTDRGTVVDVEVGCVWPPESAVPWVRRARARGVDPTVYCNWSNDLQHVKAAFIRAGEPEPHYWVARYDGQAEVPEGTVGKQYQAPEAPGAAQAGGHYDVSSMADYWPGVDGDDDMGQLEGRQAEMLQQIYDGMCKPYLAGVGDFGDVQTRLGRLFRDLDPAAMEQYGTLDPGDLTNAIVSPYSLLYKTIYPLLQGYAVQLETLATALTDDDTHSAADLVAAMRAALADLLSSEVHIQLTPRTVSADPAAITAAPVITGELTGATS